MLGPNRGSTLDCAGERSKQKEKAPSGERERPWLSHCTKVKLGVDTAVKRLLYAYAIRHCDAVAFSALLDIVPSLPVSCHATHEVLQKALVLANNGHTV